MFEFEKIFSKYEQMTFDERKELLEELTLKVMPVIMGIPNGPEAFKIIVRAACAADGDLQGAEYTLIASALGFDSGFDNTQATVKDNADLMIRLADSAVDLFGTVSDDIKAAMVAICLCVVSADRQINLKERSFIKKLIKM